MTHIPPITREAREWLRETLAYSVDIDALNSMPLTPADPLDIDLHRFEAARQFAAAWLPIVHASAGIAMHKNEPETIIHKVIGRSNELGLAMADDLLRRLREGSQ